MAKKKTTEEISSLPLTDKELEKLSADVGVSVRTLRSTNLDPVAVRKNFQMAAKTPFLHKSWIPAYFTTGFGTMTAGLVAMEATLIQLSVPAAVSAVVFCGVTGGIQKAKRRSKARNNNRNIVKNTPPPFMK